MWQCSRNGEGSRKMCLVATTAGPKLLLFDAVVHLAYAVLLPPTPLHCLRLALGRTDEVTTPHGWHVHQASSSARTALSLCACERLAPRSACGRLGCDSGERTRSILTDMRLKVCWVSAGMGLRACSWVVLPPPSAPFSLSGSFSFEVVLCEGPGQAYGAPGRVPLTLLRRSYMRGLVVSHCWVSFFFEKMVSKKNEGAPHRTCANTPVLPERRRQH